MMLKPVIQTCCLLSCAFLIQAQAASPTDPVATVNDQMITQQEYDNYLKSRNEQTGGKSVPDEQTVLEELVNRELIRQQALRQGLDKVPAFTKKMDELRGELLMSLALQDYLDKHPIDDATLKKDYDQRAAEAPKEYKVRHILVAKEEEANAILADLKNGKAFADLAQAKSSDSESAKKGGDLGWVSRQKVISNFATAMEKLKKGELAPAPVKTEFGWHIILVDDIRDMQFPPFDTVKERIRAALQNQQMQDYFKELRKDAKVSFVKEKASEAPKTSP